MRRAVQHAAERHHRFEVVARHRVESPARDPAVVSVELETPGFAAAVEADVQLAPEAGHAQDAIPAADLPEVAPRRAAFVSEHVREGRVRLLGLFGAAPVPEARAGIEVTLVDEHRHDAEVGGIVAEPTAVDPIFSAGPAEDAAGVFGACGVGEAAVEMALVGDEAGDEWVTVPR